MLHQVYVMYYTIYAHMPKAVISHTHGRSDAMVQWINFLNDLKWCSYTNILLRGLGLEWLQA